MQAIQAFLDELDHYTTLTNPSAVESLALASDLRAYLKEVSENDLGMKRCCSTTQGTTDFKPYGLTLLFLNYNRNVFITSF